MRLRFVAQFYDNSDIDSVCNGVGHEAARVHLRTGLLGGLHCGNAISHRNVTTRLARSPKREAGVFRERDSHDTVLQRWYGLVYVTPNR